MESMRSWKGDLEATSLTHTPIGRNGRGMRKGREEAKECMRCQDNQKKGRRRKEGRRHRRKEERKVKEGRKKDEKRKEGR